MTAEVAILNRNAVALAADSAVTLRLPQGTKIYQTNKLFALSKYEPVAVMIYGSADFMDVPWETIVKRYRTHLGQRSFGGIGEYGEDFLSFVEDNSAFFPADRQAFYCYQWVRNWLRMLLRRLRAGLKDKLASGRPLTETAIKAAFRSVFNAEQRNLANHSELPRLKGKRNQSLLLRRYRAEIRRAAVDELQKLADVVPRSQLANAAVSAVRRVNYWHNESGIVVAGFGRKDFFPGLRSYIADSIVAGRLRGLEEEGRRTDISSTSTAVVAAFAQGEMVSLFMNGIDDDYAAFVRSFVGQSFLVRYPRLLSKLLEKDVSRARKSKILKQMRDAGDKLISALGSGIAQYANEIYAGPIVEIVAHLPKEELAAMAEALVNLTSFKRHVTGSAETVGGPIDVAVISRGDGLIWIKRKHYFERGLNEHFLSNYYNDVSRGRHR